MPTLPLTRSMAILRVPAHQMKQRPIDRFRIIWCVDANQLLSNADTYTKNKNKMKKKIQKSKHAYTFIPSHFVSCNFPYSRFLSQLFHHKRTSTEHPPSPDQHQKSNPFIFCVFISRSNSVLFYTHRKSFC